MLLSPGLLLEESFPLLSPSVSSSSSRGGQDSLEFNLDEFCCSTPCFSPSCDALTWSFTNSRSGVDAETRRDSIYEQAEYRTLPPSRGAADLSRSLLLYSLEVSMESKRSRPRGSPSSSLSFPQDGCPGSPRLIAPHAPDSSLFSRGHSSPEPWFSLTVRAAQLGH